MRYQQNPSIETAPLGAGLMVLEPNSRRFCALNASSSAIWSRLREPASADQLADHIVEQFQGVNRTDALRDVEAAITEMTTIGIVVPIP